MTTSPAQPLLELEGIAKSFGGIQALTDIDFTVAPGEIVGLVGENGAGKSTLINIASGVHRPDRGRLSLEGESRAFSNPHQATETGIAVVHQESELFADLSLAENMLLGSGLPTRGLGWIDWSGAYRTCREALAELDLDLSVGAKARDLSVAQRVLAHIAAAIHRNAAVLFLDEPTASLTHRESKTLFSQVRRLKESGVAIVYVSHRLEEVLELSDRITVLRDGETVWTRPRAEVDMDEMVRAMVGRDVDRLFPQRSKRPGETVFEVRDWTDASGAFENVDLTLRKGEILGLYGLVGAGRSELAQSFFGLRRTKSGRILKNGETFAGGSPSRALEAGLAYLPEDRLTEGVFPSLSVRVNATSAILGKISSALGLVSRKKETKRADRVIEQTRIKTTNPETPIVTLSGGNQQKVVFGRWLETDPDVLMLDEPTRGVDVGAKAEIHRLIADAADRGKSVVLISSELPEVLGMSDRVVVLCEGNLAGEFDPATDSAETVAAAAFPVGDRGSTPMEHPTDRRFDLSRFRELGIGAALIGLMAVMTALRPDSFPTAENFMDILSSISILSVAALGATFVIAGGGIDISVGSMLGLVAAAAGMAAASGVPVPVCCGMAALMGAALGALNMGASLLGRVHPIIVTLAGLTIYRGVLRQLTGGYEVSGLPDSYRALGGGRFLGAPGAVWVSFLALALAWVLLQRTPFGRQLLAVGNSRSAADRIGLPAKRLLVAGFALNGAFIGVAAILWGAYYGKVQTLAGEGWELQAIAAAVIGGCNIMGGSGTALGTFLGACLIGTVNNSLSLLQIEAYWQPVFIGLFILITVLIDGWLLGNREGRNGQ